jgi:hypothetical protein
MSSAEQWFHSRATHYVTTQIFYALAQTGVIQHLSDHGPTNLATLAEKTGVKEEVLRSLVEYIAAVDPLLVLDSSDLVLLSEFGEAVVDRYGRREGGQLHLNLFNVRVGAYGPVWSGLPDLLRGDATYDVDIHRRGAISARALRTICEHMAPALFDLVCGSEPSFVLEVGVATGLLESIATRRPELSYYGLDRSPDALTDAATTWPTACEDSIRWIDGDFFRPQSWAGDLPAAPGLLFSIHFHELLAGGTERLVTTLRQLGSLLKGSTLVALEQPHPRAATVEGGDVLHRYAHSNVLIHHLIGNGRILSIEEWLELFRAGGCTVVEDRPIDYLGYRAFVVRLGETTEDCSD